MGKIVMALLKNLTAGVAADKNKRSKFLTLLGSIIVGTVLLLFAPLAVFISMGKTESPPVDVQFDEAAFFSKLSPEQQENIAAVEADGQAIADAMAERGLQEQTIKAQLIYMSYFGENRLSDFAYYADLFYQSNEQLIQSLNDIYGLGINFDEFMRTYIFVMNSTINEYMFTDASTKNAADLAAWAENAYMSEWQYADNCFGERNGENRLRCADNIGLIMGYVRYDTENKVFTSDTIDLFYTEQGSMDTMPDSKGVGVYNGSEFGIYVGGGEVVFSSAMGGVKRQALTDGGWTVWCTFDAVTYPQEVQDRISKLQEPTTETTTEGT